MIAKHNVKVNGQWFPAGSDVPENDTPVKRVAKAGDNDRKTETEEPVEQKPKSASRRKTSK